MQSILTQITLHTINIVLFLSNSIENVQSHPIPTHLFPKMWEKILTKTAMNFYKIVKVAQERLEEPGQYVILSFI